VLILQISTLYDYTKMVFKISHKIPNIIPMQQVTQCALVYSAKHNKLTNDNKLNQSINQSINNLLQ